MDLERKLNARDIITWDRSRNAKLDNIAVISHPLWSEFYNEEAKNTPRIFFDIIKGEYNLELAESEFRLTGMGLDAFTLLAYSIGFNGKDIRGYSRPRQFVFERYFLSKIQELGIPVIISVPNQLENENYFPVEYYQKLNELITNDNIFFVPTAYKYKGNVIKDYELILARAIDGFNGTILYSGGAVNGCAWSLQLDIIKHLDDLNFTMMQNYLYLNSVKDGLNYNILSDENFNSGINDLFKNCRDVTYMRDFFRTSPFESDYNLVVEKHLRRHIKTLKGLASKAKRKIMFSISKDYL